MFHLFEKLKNKEVYFIAEMSANHGGSLENALEIVRQAAKAGADCLKIQTYTADSLTIDCDNEYFKIQGTLWDGYKLYDLYQDAGTPYEWQGRIKEECERCGIDFLSTPFDNDAVDFLENLGCEAYKIASFELVDIPLIEYAASKGKPMIISCGMGSEDEIQDAIDACKRVGNDQIVLLKCCSEYPANWKDMHLSNIQDMMERYHVPVGLSDHSEGHLADVVGASLGACVIEKHVKLEGVKSADSEFSMTIAEYAEMVNAVKAVGTIIGEKKYGPTEGEQALLKFRRSLFAVRDIKKGEAFTSENVRSIRPSQGLKPKYFQRIQGHAALTDIPYGTPVSMEQVKSVDAIKTERLILREIREEDAQEIAALRNHPDVFRYFTNPKTLTLEEHLHWFHDIYPYDPDRYDWVATDANGKRIGLFNLRVSKDGCAEIGYLIAQEYYGKGFASEAVQAMIAYAKKARGCKTAIAEIHEENQKSLHFIQKLGFQLEKAEGVYQIYKRSL
jgi:pseudaminic acid synthase